MRRRLLYQRVGSHPRGPTRCNGWAWITVICVLFYGCSQSPLELVTAKLGSDDVHERRAAVKELATMEQQDPTEVLNLLRFATTDDDPTVQRLSITAIGSRGPAAAESLAELQTAMQDEEMSVRVAAAFAAVEVAPSDTAWVGTLDEAMRKGDGGIIVKIGRMAEQATPLVPTLVELLSDERPGIRRLSAEALGRIGQSDTTAITALKKLRSDENDRVRTAAQTALTQLQ